MKGKKIFLPLVQAISPSPMSSCLFRFPIQLPVGVHASSLTSIQSFLHNIPLPQRILSRMHISCIIPWHKPLDGCSSPTEDTFNSKHGISSPWSGPSPTCLPASSPVCPDLTLYLHSRNSKNGLSPDMRYWTLYCDASLCHPFSLECSIPFPLSLQPPRGHLLKEAF